jgi:hypothetical protein
LGTADPAAGDVFQADLRTALQTAHTSIVPKTRRARINVFEDWCEFCLEHGKDPSLSDVTNREAKLCFLLVYRLQRRHRIARSSKPACDKTVSDILLAVGQGIARLGQPDPQKEIPGSNRNHLLLSSFIKALSNADDPAMRAYPANLTILRNLSNVLNFDHQLHAPANRHACLLCTVGFFWLLRPAEYLRTTGKGRSEAFQLRHVSFTIDGRVVPATDASLNDKNSGELHHQ